MDELDVLMGALAEDDDVIDEMGASGSRTLARFRGANKLPGVPNVGRKFQFFGLGQIQWGVGSPNVQTLTANPNKPVFIRKLVATVDRVGASATGSISITVFKIGSNDQIASDEALPVEIIAPEVQGNAVYFDQAEPGTQIRVSLTNTAIPTGTDTLTVTLGAIVDTIG